ncbi:DUF72 domain-containing protein [Chitinophaga nivalis]|uniref:DUF72 domain-containing protein n=1 Tax=Chitinophaga nivalis TaxID=2991709 RepID=A0ABT3IJX6_9BACT|nr:DUF72 domain-containing protein [Chitinophaga nivalis]MCW3466060.1 DUF72 domain-containing protein [Chitinophaga nivalis]MCW3484249.1 DUF72 domain-containing protein [Chitinophaga nivalis]
MDFGANWQQYTQLDVSLLPDDPITSQVLKGVPGNSTLRIGTSGWSRKEYAGTLYPKGLKETALLTEYGRLFNCVELNATHYKIYSPDAIRKWAEKVKGRDFRFCPKVPQSISHNSSLINAMTETAAFLEGIRAFEDQLGPVFLQLSEYFSPVRKQNLYKYLEQLPRDLTFFVEVRHPDWFGNEAERREFFTTLHQLGIGAVLTDTPGRRDCLHMGLTLPKLFLRFVTQGGHPLDKARLLDWIPRLNAWKDQGLEDIYFFLHVHDGKYEAGFYEEVQAVFGLTPQPAQTQLSLF